MPISNELSDRNFVTKIARYHRVVDGVCVYVSCVRVCTFVCMCVCGGGEGLEVNLAAWLCLGFCRVLLCFAVYLYACGMLCQTPLRYAASNSMVVLTHMLMTMCVGVCGRVWACVCV